MKEIVILNVGKSNKGNLALIYTTKETIENYVTDVKFNLMGPDDIDQDEFQVTKQIGWGLSRKPYNTIISFLYIIKCIYIHTFEHLGIHVKIRPNSRLYIYSNCDLVINSGGDHMSGEYGIGTLTAFINIYYAILLHKPVVIYGDSLGYFRSPVFNYIAKYILNKTQLIILRESLSEKYLASINVTTPEIYVTADPAFLLDASSPSRISEILTNENINLSQKPTIGINPSTFISRFRGNANQEKDNSDIKEILVKTVDNLIDNLDVNIIMIPHVYSIGADDRDAIYGIVKNTKNKNVIHVIKNEYTPQDLKGIIGQCDLFIGMRMHATIASTSMLVPTVGIAYSHKMHGIIGNMLEQEKYVLNIDELEYETLISKINDAWERKEMIKRELETKIPEIKNKAMLNGKYVKDLLDSLENL